MPGRQRELGEELAVVDVEVRAADPGLTDADADLPGLRIRCRDVPDRKASRGIVDNGFHAAPSANGAGDGPGGPGEPGRTGPGTHSRAGSPCLLIMRPSRPLTLLGPPRRAAARRCWST